MVMRVRYARRTWVLVEVEEMPSTSYMLASLESAAGIVGDGGVAFMGMSFRSFCSRKTFNKMQIQRAFRWGRSRNLRVRRGRW